MKRAILNAAWTRSALRITSADRLAIFVVDGLSTDETRTIVQRIQADDPQIHLLDNPQRLQADGLNRGIDAADGEIVVRVDGHVLLAPDYVRQCVTLLREKATEGVANVGGLMVPRGETPTGRAVAAATRSPFGVPTAFHHSARAQFVDTVYLGAWPRTIFEVVGRFNPAVNTNEDYEFNYRSRRAGGKIYLSPTIRSTYFCRSSYPALWRQYHKYGIQKVQMLRLYPSAIKPRQLAAPLFVAALIGLPLMTLLWIGFGVLWLLMIAAYLVSAGVAAWRSPRSDSGSTANQVGIGPVILVFAVMHIAWGTGFWRGVVTF